VAASRKPTQSKAGVRSRAVRATPAKAPTDRGEVASKAPRAAVETPAAAIDLTTSEATVTQMADAVPLPQTGKPAEAKGEVNMTDMLETAKTYAEEAKTRMQSAFTDMSEKTKAAVAKSSKAFEELGDLTRGNLEAVVESSRIAAKGVETLGQDAAEFGRTSFEKSSATLRSFASVKSPVEFFQLQSELLSQAMDSFASESAKNSEKMLKLASDISQPISNRFSVVSDKFKSLSV
jgi:phasin family protein